MKKRFIAISQRLYEMQEYHEVREALAIDWGVFFKQYLSDFIMLPLSYTQDFSHYKPYIAGVILSGGNDLCVCNNNALNRKRDEFESSVIESCIKDSIPLLGICRGAQMIAYYFNSTINKCNNHTKPHEVIQCVNLDSNNCHSKCGKESNLDSANRCFTYAQHDKFLESIYDLVGVRDLDCKNENLDSNANFIKTDSVKSKNFHCFSVNSYHNYAIQTLGENLSALAISIHEDRDLRDFSIEAFRHNFYNIFGIMWHIERAGGMHNDSIFCLWKNAIKANLT